MSPIYVKFNDDDETCVAHGIIDCETCVIDRLRADLAQRDARIEVLEAFVREFPGDECRRQVAGKGPSLTARLLFTKETQEHGPSCIGCRAQRVLALAPAPTPRAPEGRVEKLNGDDA